MLPEYIKSLADVSFHTVGLHVRAVSVFKKKSDAVCGFLAYFCAVLRFQDPPYAPLIQLSCALKNLSKEMLFNLIRSVIFEKLLSSVFIGMQF